MTKAEHFKVCVRAYRCTVGTATVATEHGGLALLIPMPAVGYDPELVPFTSHHHDRFLGFVFMLFIHLIGFSGGHFITGFSVNTLNLSLHLMLFSHLLGLPRGSFTTGQCSIPVSNHISKISYPPRFYSEQYTFTCLNYEGPRFIIP
jgi:hypothetical protein